jgi:Protein of unknown function (DUF3703)
LHQIGERVRKAIRDEPVRDRPTGRFPKHQSAPSKTSQVVRQHRLGNTEMCNKVGWRCWLLQQRNQDALAHGVGQRGAEAGKRRNMIHALIVHDSLNYCQGMPRFAHNIRPFVDAELDLAAAVIDTDSQRAFAHLERAHVLGQRSTRHHVRAHLAMLKWALRHNDVKEDADKFCVWSGQARKPQSASFLKETPAARASVHSVAYRCRQTSLRPSLLLDNCIRTPEF